MHPLHRAYEPALRSWLRHIHGAELVRIEDRKEYHHR
jgi:hypothetical protein